MCCIDRETETATKKETDRQTESETETDRERQKDRDRQRQRDREEDRNREEYTSLTHVGHARSVSGQKLILSRLQGNFNSCPETDRAIL